MSAVVKFTMAWEQRGRKKFYYRSCRQNGRVKKTYIGSGHQAKQAAEEDLERRAVRHQEQREQHAWDALDKQIAALHTLVISLSHSSLVEAGFYQHHRGQWRKRRHHGTHITDITDVSSKS